MNEGGQIGPMSRDSIYYLHNNLNQLYVYWYSYVFPTMSHHPNFPDHHFSSFQIENRDI